MGAYRDLTGQRFGKLVVVARSHVNGSRKVCWECRCECGGVSCPTTGNLKFGLTQSCGCGVVAATTARNYKHGFAHQKDSGYYTWKGMISRCTNPASEKYTDYGGRGIKVCERWLHSFLAFYIDMRPWERGSRSLDRKDVNGDYCPENCRWATSREQCYNKRNSRKVEYKGVVRVAAEWARLLDLPHATLLARLKRGWPTWRALGLKNDGDDVPGCD